MKKSEALVLIPAQAQRHTEVGTRQGAVRVEFEGTLPQGFHRYLIMTRKEPHDGGPNDGNLTLRAHSADTVEDGDGFFMKTIPCSRVADPHEQAHQFGFDVDHGLRGRENERER